MFADRKRHRFHGLLFEFALLATVAESRNRLPSGPYRGGYEQSFPFGWRRS